MRKLKGALAVLGIVLILAAVYAAAPQTVAAYIEQILQHVGTLLSGDTSPGINPDDTPLNITSPVSNPTIAEAKRQALDEINTARMAIGLPNVTMLSTPVSSYYRAADMLNNGYFGHYSLDGYHPNYYYARLGGVYALEENLGYIYASVMKESSIPGFARNSINNMIYDDAGSDWGHRDSLLDPTNNYVDIWAVYGGNHLFLVVNMQKVWVDWSRSPQFENGSFSCTGTLTLPGSRIDTVQIYYSNPAEHSNFTYNADLRIRDGEHFYSIGEVVAGVINFPYYYPSVETIRPQTWSIHGQDFNIAFRLDPINGPGLYTIVLYAENTLPYEHPYNPEKNGDTIPVLEYTLLFP